MGLQKLIRGKTARDGEVSLPAFYAFRAGSWRDYVNLLHPPYTVWHLSYVAMGWALAPSTHWDRLGAVTLAFFLAVGISSHSLDELHGRPLKTNIPSPVLAVLAVASLLGALAIGVAGVFTISLWLLPFIVLGTFFALAYNLELARGWFHTGFWFGIAWGAFPVLTGYFARVTTALLSTLGSITLARVFRLLKDLLYLPDELIRHSRLQPGLASLKLASDSPCVNE